MAKPQMPIDGKLGKQYKVTSAYGWRVHPVEKTKKHHNGVDLWGAAETIYIEAPVDGKVIFAGPSKIKKANGEPGGFGYHVMILFKFDGKFYVSNHAHFRKGSIKVKVGQQVEAGTVIGIMGDTGMVTGKHLHWEICVGKKYVWSGNGKGYVDPIKFMKGVIAAHEAAADAPNATPDDAPVQDAPEHTAEQAEKVEAEYKASKATVKVDAPKVEAKVESKSYTIKPGDSYWAIAEKHPVEGKSVEERVKKLQSLNDNKALHPGEKLVLY